MENRTMKKLNVDWDFKRGIVDITSGEWIYVSDPRRRRLVRRGLRQRAGVTMTFREYEDWLTEQLQIVLAQKGKEGR